MIGALLLNSSTGRYHPVFFNMSPGHSLDANEFLQRYSSTAHHTNGIEDIRVATIHGSDCSERYDGYWSGCVFEWSGNNIPAMTLDFNTRLPQEIPGTPSRELRQSLRKHEAFASIPEIAVFSDKVGFQVLLVGNVAEPTIREFEGFPITYFQVETLD